jgi:thiamine pyrophosphokinase
MTGAAFIGGEGPSIEKCREIAARADVLAAADSGLMLAEDAGLRPDIIAGDMDSLDDEARLAKYAPDCVHRFPRDKDLTDTEIAVDLLRDAGCTEILLVGGGGGRLAHIFAIKALVGECGVCEWHTGRESILLLSSKISQKAKINLRGNKGAVVSVFPIGDAPHIATSENLKWPLDGLEWNAASFGISNVALSDDVTIASTAGSFLVIIEPATLLMPNFRFS